MHTEHEQCTLNIPFENFSIKQGNGSGRSDPDPAFKKKPDSDPAQAFKKKPGSDPPQAFKKKPDPDPAFK